MLQQEFYSLFLTYGVGIILVIMFLEHLNAPGFPAGILLPFIGYLAHRSQLSLSLAILYSIIGSVLGSILLYYIFYKGGTALSDKLKAKNKKYAKFINRAEEIVKYKNYMGVFLIRLIPMIRTISSIPAGLLKVPVWKFIIYSTLGITIFNSALIFFGYFTAGQIHLVR